MEHSDESLTPKDTIDRLNLTPKVSCGTVTTDRNDWYQNYLDTPTERPLYDEMPQPWEITSGSYVKTKNDRDNMGFPVCGILSKRTKDLTIVIGHGFTNYADEKFVWRGTAEDFDRTWVID
jgi:hypothetical protein